MDVEQRMSSGPNGRIASLWRSPDFLRLWASQTVSKFGSQISFLALPLTAVLTLDATPLEMGILTAVSSLPSLLVGFLLGAWIDRRRRRPILIVSDWARAAAILVIPAAFLLDVLSLELLYAIAFLLGLFGLAFEVSYRSYLPAVVAKKDLVDANSKLEAGRSVAELAGPGIGGALVQLLGAPVALVVDAVSFVVSALILHTIRKHESEPDSGQGRSLLDDAWRGIKTVWRASRVRSLVLAAATIVFFSSALEAVFLIYVTDDLDVSAGLLGLIFTAGGVGLIIGATAAPRAVRTLGIGTTVTLALALLAIADLALPLAAGPKAAVVIILCAGQLAFGIGLAIWNTGQVSIRQALTNDDYQGRVNATFQVVTLSAVPAGALIGGLLGEQMPLRSVLFIAIAGEATAVLVLLASSFIGFRIGEAGR